MPEEIKRIPLYIADKQSSIRVPVGTWKKMKYNEIENGESLNGLMIRLLNEHYGTTNQAKTYESLKDANANELINSLLNKYFAK